MVLVNPIRGIRRSPTLQIVLVSALSVALSLTSVWLFGTAGPKPGIVVVIAGTATFLLSYIVPAIIVFLVLYRALQERMPRKAQVRVIVSSYACMIVVFTGVYFSMQFAGDHEYATDHYFYYKYGGQDLARGRIQRLNPYPDTTLAFIGIKKRLWGTVDDYLPRGIYRDLEDIERYRADWASRAGFRDVVRFRRDAVWPVLGDCLHLSVITITTVGYGNIAPNTWYAKLATNVEALTGTVLVVIALGMLFSGMRGVDVPPEAET